MPILAGIDEGQRLEVLDAGELVLELDAAEVAEGRRLEGRSPVRRAAVVELPDQEPAARPQVLGGGDLAPGVRHVLRVRAPVDPDDHGVPPARVEAGGLDQGGVQGRSVLRLDVHPLEARALEVEDRRVRVLLEGPALRAVLAADPHPRGGRDVRPGVRVEPAVGGHHGPVRAVLAGEAGASRAVQADAVEVPLARVLLVRGEVEEAGALVEHEPGAGAHERHLGVHRPGALRHRAARPGQVADVDVGEAVPLGEPEEAPPVLQEARGAEGVEEGLRALGEHRPRRARAARAARTPRAAGEARARSGPGSGAGTPPGGSPASSRAGAGRTRRPG